ncbi:MAG: efflux RND transporter periplasmic adaptor subunit [Alcanivoracaceae bacterium]|nr:efflux RND transporter periplasmic adaptor subunit [Alcanivoracaceae bacterium]
MTITARVLAPFALLGAFLSTPLLALEALTVEGRSVADVIVVDGTVEAINKATLTAQTQGRVTAIYFDVDDYVEQGQLILELENGEQKSQVSRASGAVEEARAAEQEASRNFSRVEELVQSGTLSRADFDRSKAALDATRARIKQAEAGLDQARQQLSYTQVVAPYPGILTDRFVETGELATPGKPLVAGLSLDRIRITATVPQRYVDAVRRQQALTVLLDDGSRLSSDKVTVFPYAESGSHSFRIRAELDSTASGIYPGMFARVEVVTGSREIILIPPSALLRNQELVAVYVLDEQDRPRLIQVRIGRQLEDGVEILSGLRPGTRIAKNVAEVLSQGAPR